MGTIRTLLLIYTLPLLVAGVLTGCNDEDDGLKTQDHDDNEMMSIIHATSDEMSVMKMSKETDHDFAMTMKVHHQGPLI